MKIEQLRASATKYGIERGAFDEIKALADTLPESSISAQVDGLSETESATLLSRLLWAVASEIGIAFTHPNILKEFRFPVVEPAIAAHTVEAAINSEAELTPDEQNYDSAN